MLYFKDANGGTREAIEAHIDQFVGSMLFSDSACTTTATLAEAEAELDVPQAASKKFVDDVIAGTVGLAGGAGLALTNVAAKGITISKAGCHIGCVEVNLPTDKVLGADAKAVLLGLADTMIAGGAKRIGTTDPVVLRWGEGKTATALVSFEANFA